MRKIFCFSVLLSVFTLFPAHANNLGFSKNICKFDILQKTPFDYNIRHCIKLIESDDVDEKTKAHAYGVIASKYHNDGDYRSAYEYYQISLQMDETSAAFHRRFSNLNLSFEQIDAAEFHARYALSLEPDSSWSHLSVGLVAEAKQNWDEAAKRYKSVTALKPNRLEGWLALSRVLKTTKRFLSAKKELLKVYDFAVSGGKFHRKYDQESATLFNRPIGEKELIVRELAYIEFKLGKYKNGLAFYDTLIESNPSPHAYLLRAKYLDALPANVVEQKYERILEDLTAASAKDPSWSEAQEELVDYYISYQNYDKALAVNSRYLFHAKREGLISNALWNRGTILSARGETKSALKFSTKAVSKAYEDGNYDFLQALHERFTRYKFAPDTLQFLNNEADFLDAATACTIIAQCMTLTSW